MRPVAPVGIAAGPDGNVWFTDPGLQYVGRITPQGVFTNVTGYATVWNPTGIVSGPDGNLWFMYTGVDGPAIGRLSPAGEFTGFPTSAGYGLGYPGNSWPNAINVGPDGNLWFTDGYNNTVGHLTTAGVFFSAIADAQLSDPNSLAVGPDGNLWVTNNTNSSIARIWLTAPPPPPPPPPPPSTTTTTVATTSTTTTPPGSPDPELVLSTDVVSVNGTFTIESHGWQPGTSVVVTLHSAAVVLATLTADATGTVHATLTIPPGTTTGVHKITLSGLVPGGGTHEVSAVITVTAADTAGTLPVTGTDAGPLAGLAMLLMTTGTGLVLIARRRHAARAR